MTYELMESTLIERVAELRNSEADFSRSMSCLRNGESNIELNAQYIRMNAQLDEVEKLLARMEAAELAEATPMSVVASSLNPSLLAA